MCPLLAQLLCDSFPKRLFLCCLGNYGIPAGATAILADVFVTASLSDQFVSFSPYHLFSFSFLLLPLLWWCVVLSMQVVCMGKSHGARTTWLARGGQPSAYFTSGFATDLVV